MSRASGSSNELSAAYATQVAMLLNAILIAIALSVSVLSGGGAPVATERNWRSPQTERPDDPFRVYEELLLPRV